MEIRRGIKKDVFTDNFNTKIDQPLYINTYNKINGETVIHVDSCFTNDLPSLDIINSRLAKSAIKNELRSLYFMLTNPIEAFNMDKAEDNVLYLNTVIYLDVLSILELELIVRYFEDKNSDYNYLDELLQVITHSGMGYDYRIRSCVKKILANKYNLNAADNLMRIIPKNLQRKSKIEDEPINIFKVYNRNIFYKIKNIIKIVDAMLECDASRYMLIEALFGYYVKHVKIPNEFINICLRGVRLGNLGTTLQENNDDMVSKYLIGRRINVGKWYEFIQNLITSLEISANAQPSNKNKSTLCTYSNKFRESTLHSIIGELQITIADALEYAKVNKDLLDSKMVAASLEEKKIKQAARNKIQANLYNDYTQEILKENKEKEDKALRALFKEVKKRRKYKL